VKCLTASRRCYVRCTDTSDPGHFGMTEVSRRFGTSSTYIEDNHIADYAKAYPWIAENNFNFNSSGLYRAALSLGGELQSLVLTMSSCSAHCSIASGLAEIIRRAWLQTTNQLENGGRQRIKVSASNTRETEWRSYVNT